MTDHIDVLNEYFNTVSTLQDQVQDYQTLLQQRLFWLPSATVVSKKTVGGLYQSAKWFVSQSKPEALSDAIKESVDERGGRIAFIALLLTVLLIRRKAIARHLKTNGRHIGNVGQDRTIYTL